MKKFNIAVLAAAASVILTPAAAQAASFYTVPVQGRVKVIVGTLGDCAPLPGLPGNPELPNLPDIPSLPERPEQPTPPDAPVLPDTPEQPDNPGTGLPETPPAENTYAAQVVALVNAERAKAGLPALAADMSVQKAADVRAREIAGSFSHTRPDGSHFSSALTENGVSFRGAGENIAWGQKSPEEVVTGWMNSPGHRANILNSSFTTIGAGYYQNSAGVQYWTQLFIR